MNGMKALLWKDYRANLSVLIVGLVLLLAPYLVVVGLIWYDPGLTRADAGLWAGSLFTGAHVSLAVSQLTILLLAGHVIAGERRDRSAEFLAYLPPSRPAVLTSKSLLCAATVIVIWGLSLAMLWLVAPRLSGQVISGSNARNMGEFLSVMAASGAALFGMAWLASSMLESPTYSTATGLVTIIAVPFLLNAWYWLTGKTMIGQKDDFLDWLRILYAGIGAAGFLAGWTYYVRRVEP